MPTEVKFRVFCEKHNRWEYYTLGDLVCGSTTENNGEGGIFKGETWCRYTGLKDKNEKDIYEGDVIRTPRGQWGIIVYEAPFFQVTVAEDQSSLYTRDFLMSSEIIGNIFDNPELLTNA